MTRVRSVRSELGLVGWWQASWVAGWEATALAAGKVAVAGLQGALAGCVGARHVLTGRSEWIIYQDIRIFAMPCAGRVRGEPV